MTDEQLWLAYVELQTGCMYLSDAISMRFQPGRPTVPMALLWLASQHTVKPKHLPRSGALPSSFGQSRPPNQPVWRHVAQPDDPKPGMTDAEPEETSLPYPSLEFDPHSKPVGRGGSGTIWQGLVCGQSAAVKVSHPDSPDSIAELHTDAQFYPEHTELQGSCIPCLLGQGWIQFDDEETPAYWLATSLEGPALSRLEHLTDAIVEAAKQALVEYHASGAEHNDVRWDNIVLKGRTLLLNVLLLHCMLPSFSQNNWDMTMIACTRCNYTVAALLATCVSPYHHRCTLNTSNLC